MQRFRNLLAVIGLAATLVIGAGAAAAQDAPDFTAQCASLEQSQVQLNTQVAQFDASIAAARAQIDAMDAQLGPAYDAIFANARAYYSAAEITYDAQVALAQAQLDAGFALYGC